MTSIELTSDEISALFVCEGKRAILDVEKMAYVDEATAESQMAKYQVNGWTVVKAGPGKTDPSVFYLTVVKREVKPSKKYPFVSSRKALQELLANS